MKRLFRRRYFKAPALNIPRHMFTIIFCLLSAFSASSQVDYSKSIDEYRKGNLSSSELLNIINASQVETVSTSSLDVLAANYVSSLQAEGEVNANFFPGVDKIIGGFVQQIKDEKLKNVLSFLFPAGKSCNVDQMLIEVGAHEINNVFSAAGKETPASILKYINKD